MRLADIEWPLLRGAVGIFCLSLLLGALVLAVSAHFRDQKARLFKEQEAQFRDISHKYSVLNEKRQILKLHYPRFVKFHDQGIIGQEQRLNWVETLKSAGAKLKIPSLRYEIDLRQPYTPDFSLSAGPYQIYTSTMRLDLGMLHEGDLVRLLQELDKNAAGLYSIKEYSLKRLGAQLKHDLNGQNLSAECRLLWYTIHLSSGDEIVF
jgi:hypothetical protein